MASTSALSMSLPLTRATQKKALIAFKPSTAAVVATTRHNGSKLVVKASSSSSSSSFSEKMITGLTAAALTSSMMIPDVAQAAEGVTPSLKNFLLSITAGGVVLVAIIGVVVGVSNFDPVNRG